MGAARLGFLLSVLSVSSAIAAEPAVWQYYVPFDRGPDNAGRAQEPGKALLWLPPGCQTVRGLLVMGQLGTEGELAVSPQVRQVCIECDLAIVYFQPHISGTFHYWEPGGTLAQRWLKALDDLAGRTAHPEIRRVPWITAGHSTAGIFCRNVAYWQPRRVAGVVHIKSGNFWQKEHLPPEASLAGVPLLAINGQFETFGPAEGIQPELGRQTQWMYVLRNIQRFRQQDPQHLMSIWVHHGDDHFHGAPELEDDVALFLRKCAQYRLPRTLPAGDGPIECLPFRAEQGWLTDPDLYQPKHAPAGWVDYSGDRSQAMWHFDRELAEASAAWHRLLGRHQCLDAPALELLEDGDGWSFKAKAVWLDKMPAQYGGTTANQPVSRAAGPVIYRCKNNEPVIQVGPDTFRLLRLPTGRRSRINIAAFHPGDAAHRSTIRWAALAIPAVKGAAQTITMEKIAQIRVSAPPVELKATASSGLPVYLEVDYGPLAVRDGRLVVTDLPRNPQFPIECRITAYQIGRRIAPAMAAAAPVSCVLHLVP